MLRVTCYVLQSHQKHRQENIDFNNNRVNEAETEAELWKIANEVTNPKKQNEWAIELNGEIVKEEIKVCLVTILKVLKIKRQENIVNGSSLFTQISYLEKTYTATAREPSIYLTYDHSFLNLLGSEKK